MEEKKKSGLSTAGLVLGIIGICTSFMPIINNLSFVMGVLAIVFGLIAFIKNSGKVKNIIVVVLGILAIMITINSQKALSDSLNDTINTFNEDINNLNGKNTEEVLKNIDVEIGNFEVTKNNYLTETKLIVKITNKTSETKSFNIQIEAVKEDGTRITTDTVYANNLNAGQSQEFNTFTLVSSDNIETLKNATFKVVEASMY